MSNPTPPQPPTPPTAEELQTNRLQQIAADAAAGKLSPQQIHERLRAEIGGPTNPYKRMRNGPPQKKGR